MQTRRLVTGLAEAVSYGVVFTAVATVASGVLSLLIGGGLVGVKWILFVIGWLAFGYAVFRLYPTPAWKRAGQNTDRAGGSILSLGRDPFEGLGEDDEPTSDRPPGSGGSTDAPAMTDDGGRDIESFYRGDETGLLRVARRLPPARFFPRSPATNWPVAADILVGSVFVLVTSFLMEAVLRVGY